MFSKLVRRPSSANSILRFFFRPVQCPPGILLIRFAVGFISSTQGILKHIDFRAATVPLMVIIKAIANRKIPELFRANQCVLRFS